jgi:predicted cupin superfamily sugar epimerase
MHHKAKYYIQKLKLKKHPEGGFYREIYRSGEIISGEDLPARYRSSHNFSTSIYFLLEGKQFSAFHILQSDEIWHFYDGSNVIIYIIDQKGRLLKRKIGKGEDCNYQTVIEKESWFAAELEMEKSFALVGCTVSPGFEFDDFKKGKREVMIKQFPMHKKLIEKLTFAESNNTRGQILRR